MTVPRKTAAPGKLLKPPTQDLESPAAIAVVDDILAGVGLTHGSRSTRRDTWTEGARRLVGRKSEAEARALVKPEEDPQPLQSKLLKKQSCLVHGFSTRAGGVSRCYRPHLPAGLGDLNLGYTKHDEASNVAENRQRFLRSIPADGFEHFGMLHQRHTPILRHIRSLDDAATDFTKPATMRGDALVTSLPGVLLTVQVADCIPVLLFDPRQRVIAAIHAGWRGTLARIVERTVGTMRLEYGCDPADILAAIGAGIGPGSYAVGEEVRHEFASQFDYADALFADVYDSDPVREKYPLLFLTARAPGHSPIGPQLHLNLWQANRRQLLAAGVAGANIDVLEEDTAADTGRFFSYRAEDGFTGRMMAAIGLTT